MIRAVLFLFVAISACRNHSTGKIEVEAGRTRLPADGFSSTTLETRPSGAEIRVVEGTRVVRTDGNRVTSTVLPGRAVLEIRAPGYSPRTVAIETQAAWSDRFGDGTPDFLRLDDAGDREAFANTFAKAAEEQYFREAPSTEVSDCSSLIRYAYRESFRLPGRSGKYEHPWTPLGPRLFRIAPGPLQPDDLVNNLFSEFADAESLRRWNTYFISRDVSRASRGDLLFFRQSEQRSPFHAMIFAGRSQIEDDSAMRVVYHTGPTGSEPGEIRRPSVEELLRHPQPKWRPVPGNSNFLGIWRWNILKQES